MKRGKRVTNIGRQKDENEKRGYKSQSGTKKGGKRKELQILEGKRGKKGYKYWKAKGPK